MFKKMKTWRALSVLGLLGGGLAAPALVPTAAAAAPPPTPFTECPPVGADTSCELLIVINPNGTTTVYNDPSQGPYDGADDTLVGVVNMSNMAVASLNLNGGATTIFAFDGSGICSTSITPHPAACPFGPTGYEGPDTSFTVTSPTTGTVNFTTPLSPGGSCAHAGTAYFGLEEHVSSLSLTVGTTSIGRAFGLAVGSPTLIAGVADTNYSATPTEVIVGGFSSPPGVVSASAAAFDSTVGFGASEADVGSVTIVAGNVVISAQGVVARACPTQGTTVIGSLQVAGATVDVGPLPNTTVPIPGVGTLVLNEQYPSPSATTAGLVVNAIHLYVTNPLVLSLGPAEVIVASAESYV
jgi:hypothetical protein